MYSYRRKAPLAMRRPKTYAKKKATAPRRRYVAMPRRSTMGKSGGVGEESMQLKTIENIAIPAATYTIFTFIMNNPYNPLGTASARQPAGYDFWKVMYTRFHVRSGAYKICFSNTGATPVTVATYTSDQAVVGGATVSNLINQFAGQPGAKWALADPSGSGKAGIRMTRSFSSLAVLGKYDPSSQTGLTNAADQLLAQKIYCYVLVAAQSGNVTGNLTVEADQNTTFYAKVAAVDS